MAFIGPLSFIQLHMKAKLKKKNTGSLSWSFCLSQKKKVLYRYMQHLKSTVVKIYYIWHCNNVVGSYYSTCVDKGVLL